MRVEAVDRNKVPRLSRSDAPPAGSREAWYVVSAELVAALVRYFHFGLSRAQRPTDHPRAYGAARGAPHHS